MKRTRPRRAPRVNRKVAPTVVRLSSYRSSDQKPVTGNPNRLSPFISAPAGSGRIRTGAPGPVPSKPVRLPPLVQSEGALGLVLPLPPSINHQYATVHGRRVLSSAGRRFKALVGQEVLCALAGRRTGQSLLGSLNGAPLALDLRFYFVSGLRRDIDGGLKITQDAVCEALGINDNRIIEVTLRKETDPASPRLELWLRAASRQILPQ